MRQTDLIMYKQIENNLNEMSDDNKTYKQTFIDVADLMGIQIKTLICICHELNENNNCYIRIPKFM